MSANEMVLSPVPAGSGTISKLEYANDIRGVKPCPIL